jgi:hypothetical protein
VYDVIGDIHGHHDALVALLERLDYRRVGDHYAHPERTAVFVGDLIDRGPRIFETVRLVRRMVDAGAARIVMGNHEFNAIAWQIRDPRAEREFLRSHGDQKLGQHLETLRQLNSAELADAVEWFRTLPRWLELDGIRVVHACWDPPHIAILEAAVPNGERFHDAAMNRAVREGDPLFDAVEIVLKGREVWLPGETRLKDKEGHGRRKMRVAWYESPAERTYANYGFPLDPNAPHEPIDLRDVAPWEAYPPDAPPVFIGHYWVVGPPTRLAANVACVDYSVAKGGLLCAYRWDGERELDDANFVTVSPQPV